MFKTLIAALVLVSAPLFADEATMGDDGLHKTDWIHNDTFLDLREDLETANAEGKRLAIIVEQRGCIYCTRMHENVFPLPDINALLSDDYYFIQINMFGDLEVTDFDGEVMSERDIVKKWAVFFTPSILFMPEEAPESGNAARNAVAVMPGAFGHWMTLNMLTWVLDRGYDTDEHFQAYHARMFASQRDG